MDKQQATAFRAQQEFAVFLNARTRMNGVLRLEPIRLGTSDLDLDPPQPGMPTMETCTIRQDGGNRLQWSVGVANEFEGPDGASHLSTKPGFASSSPCGLRPGAAREDTGWRFRSAFI